MTAGRGNVAQGVAPLAQARSPAADDAALDRDRALGLDQLPDHRRGQRLPGPDPAPRAEAGHAADQRPEQRVAAEAAVELGRGRSRARARSASARSPARAGRDRPGPARRSAAIGARHSARGRAARPAAPPAPRPAARPAPAPGCRRRAAAASRRRRRSAASGRRSRAAAGTASAAAPRASSGRGGQRPSRWTSTRKERLATTLGRSRRRREAARGARLRADGADRAHGGDGGGAGQDATGRGDRGGADLAAQDRRQAGLLVGQRQRPHRLRVRRLGVFLGEDLAVKFEVTHRADSSEAPGRFPSTHRNCGRSRGPRVGLAKPPHLLRRRVPPGDPYNARSIQRYLLTTLPPIPSIARFIGSFVSRIQPISPPWIAPGFCAVSRCLR